MKTKSKIGSKLLAWVLTLAMVITFIPMTGSTAYAGSVEYTNSASNYGITLESDKAEYEVGEDIYLQVTGSSNVTGNITDEWIGIYTTNDGGTIDTKSLFWAYTDGSAVGDVEDFIIYGPNKSDAVKAGEGNPNGDDLEPGTYYIHLMAEGGASDRGRWCTLPITIVESETEPPVVEPEEPAVETSFVEVYTDETATTTTDEVAAGEPVYVRANSVETDEYWPWIGLYKGELTCETWTKSVESLVYGYAEEASGNQTVVYNGETAVDLTAKGSYDKWQHGTEGELEPGTYTIILFKSWNDYGPVAYKQFTVTGEVEEPDVDKYEGYDITFVPEETLATPIVLDGVTFEAAYTQHYAEGMDIKITAPADADSNIWVGIYPHDWDPSTQGSLAWIYVKDFAGTTEDEAVTFDLIDAIKNASAANGGINDEAGMALSGYRKLVLFADGGYTVADTAYFFLREDVSGTTVTLSETEFTYNGQAQAPTVTNAGGYEFEAAIPTDSVNVGKYNVDVKFVNRYGGKSTATYVINPKAITAEDITVEVADQDYTGEALTPAVVVKDGETVLAEGTDYDVEYKDNVKTGTATVVITAKGNYNGSVEKTFEIVCKHDYKTDVVDATCTEAGSITYTCECGDEYTEPIPAKGHVNLKKTDAVAATCDKDGNIEYYTCECGKLFADAEAKKEITKADTKVAKGHNYKAVVTAPTCVEEGFTTYTCEKCGQAYVADIKAPTGEHTVVNVDAVPATFEADGTAAGTQCSVCNEKLSGFETVAAIGTVGLSKTKLAYTGKAQTPAVAVVDKDGKTIDAANYTVEKVTKCTAVGVHKVKVVFSGAYSGEQTLTFTIVPKAPTSVKANLRTVSGGYDDVKVSWAKATGATGYTVYYKKGTGSYKVMTTTTKTSVTKSNLSDGVKYTFKVVPYYKSGNTKYSSLSYKTAYTYTLKKLNAPKVTKSGTKVKVKWNNISGETGYQVSRATKKTGTNIVATVKTTTGVSKVVKANKSKKYYYKVRAYKVVDGKKVYGPWSATKAFTRK